VLHSVNAKKDIEFKNADLLNTIRELDAKHKNEIANLQKEFAREKNSLISSKHKDVIENALETIDEVNEETEDGLANENTNLFYKLEDERKKNNLLEETIRSMRKKYKDEIDQIKVENSDLKHNLNSLEKEYKTVKDKHSKRKEKMLEMRNIF